MSNPSLAPRGENLRRVLGWLADHGGWTMELLEEACRRFDLGPADEEFLIREFRRSQAQREP
jgi:hypothetical protein